MPSPDEAGPSTSSPSTSGTPISALFPPIIPNSSYVIDDRARPIQRPYTTQRCLSFCSQSSIRRDTGWDPVCRAICWKVDRSGEADQLRSPGYLDRQRAERAALEDGSMIMTKRKDLKEPEASLIEEFAKSVSYWINQRSITAFRGTMEEMAQMQREGQVHDPAWDAPGTIKSNYFDTIDRRPSYEHGRAQKRWEEMCDLECDLRESYAREAATEAAQAAVAAAADGIPAAIPEPPARPTTLAERQFMKLVKDEEEHLARHQKQREQARSFRDHNPAKFNYHSEPLPSGGSWITFPLSSFLVTPFCAIRDRAHFIFSPSWRLGKMYVETFKADDLTGKSTQVRGLEKMYDQIVSGKVLEFGGKALEKCGEVWGGWLGLDETKSGKAEGGPPGRGPNGSERRGKDE